MWHLGDRAVHDYVMSLTFQDADGKAAVEKGALGSRGDVEGENWEGGT